MSDGPPRGMRQSIESRCRMNSTAASWRRVLDQHHASAGSPALAKASRSTAAMAMFDAIAPDEPRQERRVARLEAQPGRVAGDVRRFS